MLSVQVGSYETDLHSAKKRRIKVRYVKMYKQMKNFDKTFGPTQSLSIDHSKLDSQWKNLILHIKWSKEPYHIAAKRAYLWIKGTPISVIWVLSNEAKIDKRIIYTFAFEDLTHEKFIFEISFIIHMLAWFDHTHFLLYNCMHML